MEKLLKKCGLYQAYSKKKRDHYYSIGIRKVMRIYNRKLDSYDKDCYQHRILVVGYLGRPKKKFFYRRLYFLKKEWQDTEIVMLDEVTFASNYLGVYGYNVLKMPSFNEGLKFCHVDAEEMKREIEEKQYLQNAIQNEILRGMDRDDAEKSIYLKYLYYKKAVEKIQPDYIMLWNKFSSEHSVMDNICKEKNIKVIYIEYGLLPGTFCLEELGQMGESVPAVCPEDFKKQSVTEDELKEAEAIWEYLRTSGINRNTQINDDIVGKVSCQIKKDRPIILYAGNYDFDCGIVPYTEDARKYHSPNFESSHDAMLYLADLAKRNDWNLIYKPHPIMVRKTEIANIPENVIYVPEGNLNDLIDYSDLVVTLMSQTAYVSCIRNTATLMLGYNQLKNKGCVYEAYSLESIESEIKTAIENGFTELQRNNFKIHIAQLCKYYLFDGSTETDEKHFGRDEKELGNYIRGHLS
ncbi:MAG: hypothetical protein PUB19_08635 [Lachnospiraceae bacterium]|nr:hypothetical protein [Lachnospiraceae bacterium]